ncbi:hypothetical protein HPB48_017010 [Haemaphysalis longicornis]|uniref:Reverse transcriptase domain-containing protein n=1 Tax=Haemaphysalis longicornis TaxID=44386 RepID=A0A9J6G6X2_HAELO|nr:hypothetical protein HPB48_017010 [Haemaphysalis longicornis]
MRFLIYANDVTLWSPSRDLSLQCRHLQQALHVFYAFAQSVGLKITAEKSCYVKVANKAARNLASMANFQPKIGSATVLAKEELRVLGLLIHRRVLVFIGSEMACQDYSTTLHLIRGIATRSGGARKEAAGHLSRTVVQPRITLTDTVS